MTTPCDLVPLPEGHLYPHQTAEIRSMRRRLLHATSPEEVYSTLSLYSEATNVSIPDMLLWQEEGQWEGQEEGQEEGQKRRNTLFWLVDEGAEGVAMHICQILLDGDDKETLSELVNAGCYIHGEPKTFWELAESRGAEDILNMLEEVGV
ncbi:hypothetical protein B0T20DRAFT_407428 [Sordaria brevicollis]|uniref:Uncharacterized protein n=1 Tax=Sordaria brevicollis TaxID=83679 RepID=A0AAE0UDM5_SORBR|nr:hypothetical protein B0T20DRAFT_407428 [Sordaria brevicollis]